MNYRVAFVGLFAMLLAAAEPLGRAPSSAAALVNPYEGVAEAAEAGAKLYRRHCAACHGADREGRGRTPALKREEVMQASPGALFWVLKNGALAQGMPSWSKLPDQQRWQLVSYLKK